MTVLLCAALASQTPEFDCSAQARAYGCDGYGGNDTSSSPGYCAEQWAVCEYPPVANTPWDPDRPTRWDRLILVLPPRKPMGERRNEPDFNAMTSTFGSTDVFYSEFIGGCQFSQFIKNSWVSVRVIRDIDSPYGAAASLFSPEVFYTGLSGCP